MPPVAGLMKTVYVSGPISAVPGHGALYENCMEAIEAASELMRSGNYAVVCVHALALIADVPDCSYGHYMKMDLEILQRCDVLALVTKRYHHSIGTCAEIEHAKKLQLPIRFYRDLL